LFSTTVVKVGDEQKVKHVLEIFWVVHVCANAPHNKHSRVIQQRALLMSTIANCYDTNTMCARWKSISNIVCKWQQSLTN